MPHNQTSATNFTLRKMQALADNHSQLELFGDSLGHSTVFSDGVNNAASISKHLWNGKLLPDSMAHHPRRQSPLHQ